MPRRRRTSTRNGNPATSKAELIRQTATEMGSSARVRDVVAALKQQGVSVSSPQVSKTLKAAGIKLKRRGRRRQAAGAGADAAGGTKAERIRQLAQRMKKPIRPRDIIAELASEGLAVSSAQVSAVLREAGYRRRRRRRRLTAEPSARSAASNGLNLDALIAAKALIDKVGSVEVAEEAIRAMKKLQ
jgi:arginine repressor